MIIIIILIIILIIIFYLINKIIYKKKTEEHYLTYFLPFFDSSKTDLSNFYADDDNNKNYLKKKFNYHTITFGSIPKDYIFGKILLDDYISKSFTYKAKLIIYKDRLRAYEDIRNNNIDFAIANYSTLIYNMHTYNINIRNLKLICNLYNEYFYFFTKKKYNISSLNEIPPNIIIGILNNPDPINFSYNKLLLDIGYTENIDYKIIRYDIEDILYDSFLNDNVNMILFQHTFPNKNINNFLSKNIYSDIILLPFDIKNDQLFFKKNPEMRKTSVDLNLLSSSYLPQKFSHYEFTKNTPDLNMIYIPKILITNIKTNSDICYNVIKFLYENYKNINNITNYDGFKIDSIGMNNSTYLDYHNGVKLYYKDIGLITNINNDNCKYLIGNMECNEQNLKNNNLFI